MFHFINLRISQKKEIKNNCEEKNYLATRLMDRVFIYVVLHVL